MGGERCDRRPRRLGAARVDFTSALYLGLGHASAALPGWRRLTAGRPAALSPPAGEAVLARRLAAHLGAGAAVVGRTALHLFHDLAALAAARPVLADAGAYPIARWAFAAARPRSFAHHDPAALEAALAALARPGAGAPPVVIADGVCPSCGTPAPLAAYLAAVRRAGGLLLLDDTQAVGVLGASPSPARPWGRGGGGTALHLGLDPRRWPELIVVASLAKAYGAPLAVAAGAGRPIGWLAGHGPNRTHSSPPTAADLAAAHRALDLEARCGEALRACLLANVRRWRRRLASLGLAPPGRAFPVQTLPVVPDLAPGELHLRLAAAGFETVLAVARCPPHPAVTLLLTAAHRREQIDRAATALARALR